MNVIKILSIGKFTLAIYYTKSDCYKYSIIDDYGTVLEQDSICYTAEAAEREGREAINTVSRDARAVRSSRIVHEIALLSKASEGIIAIATG